MICCGRELSWTFFRLCWIQMHVRCCSSRLPGLTFLWIGAGDNLNHILPWDCPPPTPTPVLLTWTRMPFCFCFPKLTHPLSRDLYTTGVGLIFQMSPQFSIGLFVQGLKINFQKEDSKLSPPQWSYFNLEITNSVLRCFILVLSRDLVIRPGEGCTCVSPYRKTKKQLSLSSVLLRAQSRCSRMLVCDINTCSVCISDRGASQFACSLLAVVGLCRYRSIVSSAETASYVIVT